MKQQARRRKTLTKQNPPKRKKKQNSRRPKQMRSEVGEEVKFSSIEPTIRVHNNFELSTRKWN